MAEQFKDIRTVSVFSGAGGLDIGAIEAGAHVIWANDMMKEAARLIGQISVTTLSVVTSTRKRKSWRDSATYHWSLAVRHAKGSRWQERWMPTTSGANLSGATCQFWKC